MKIHEIKKNNLYPGEKYQNASVISWKNKLLLFYQVQEKLSDKKNKIFVCFLDGEYQPIKGSNIKIMPKKNTGQFLEGRVLFEDSRAFLFKGGLFLAYSIFNLEYSVCLMRFCQLDKNFQVTNDYFIDYGNNLLNLKALKGGKKLSRQPWKLKWERNWQFFEYQKKLYFTYLPHRVCRISLHNNKINKKFVSPQKIYWEYGAIRGGTPPIMIGDTFYSFFHSYEIKNKAERLYHIGAYSFKLTNGFKIANFTRKPILSGKIEEIYKMRAVVFPCGAIYDGNKWIVSYGEDDKDLRIMEISHKELLEKMAIPGVKDDIRFFFSKVLAIGPTTYLNINEGIGQIGLILKKISPKTYHFLKKYLKKIF